MRHNSMCWRVLKVKQSIGATLHRLTTEPMGQERAPAPGTRWLLRGFLALTAHSISKLERRQRIDLPVAFLLEYSCFERYL